MRDFVCPNWGHRLTFENSTYPFCGAALELGIAARLCQLGESGKMALTAARNAAVWIL